MQGEPSIAAILPYLAAPAALQFWTLRVNMLSAIAFGMSLVALFARYPQPLASWRLLAAVTLACLGLLLASLFDALVNAAEFTVVVFLLGVAAVVLARRVQEPEAQRTPTVLRELVWSVSPRILRFPRPALAPMDSGETPVVARRAA